MQLMITQFVRSALVVFILIGAVIDVNGAPDSALKVNVDEKNAYEVGFKTLELFDHSRTAREKYDYFGNLIERETGRPIQVCIWYPAENPENNLPMVFSEYNFPYPEDNRFIDYISEIQNREIAFLQRLLQGDQAMVMDILNDEVDAVRDASYADGRFLLIIYAPDAGYGISESFGLMEYLAGHGYIVAAVHSVGAYRLNPGTNSIDLETLIRDMEFAMSSLKEHPHIDINKIGLLGCGFGADAVLLLKMRNYDINALVCLENRPAEYSRTELMPSNPFFNPARVNVPVLRIKRSVDSEDNSGIMDSMNFSARYVIDFLPDTGICLTNYEKYSAVKNNPSGELSEINNDSYNALCSYTRSFFDAFLTGDEKAKSFWAADSAINNTKSEILEIKYFPAKQAPPTELQFINIINNQGLDTAVELYKKFKPDYPDHIFFREGTFNIMGYRYLQSGRAAEALVIFELNADAYPNSANVWDSYGEVCLEVRNYRKALENYKKALEVLPEDTTTSEQFKELIRNAAPQQIQRIEELIKQSESGEN